MTTGAYWNVSDPSKPWGEFDPDDKIKIPFDFADFITSQSSAYASHTLDADVNLTATNVTVASGVVVVMVEKAIAGTLNVGEKYGVTCQVTLADGQRKSQTVWLKAKEQ